MGMRYDNSLVRRQERLLTEEAAADLLRTGEYGVLSMADAEGGAYGVPLNYVWDGGESIYIHCAPEGRKLRLLAGIPAVSFCIVGRTNVLSSKFTTEYESVVLECRAFVELGEEEKRRALMLILEKYSPGDMELGKTYMEKSFARTGIIRLDVGKWSGKTKAVR